MIVMWYIYICIYDRFMLDKAVNSIKNGSQDAIVDVSAVATPFRPLEVSHSITYIHISYYIMQCNNKLYKWYTVYSSWWYSAMNVVLLQLYLLFWCCYRYCCCAVIFLGWWFWVVSFYYERTRLFNNTNNNSNRSIHKYQPLCVCIICFLFGYSHFYYSFIHYVICYFKLIYIMLCVVVAVVVVVDETVVELMAGDLFYLPTGWLHEVTTAPGTQNNRTTIYIILLNNTAIQYGT